LTSDDDEELFGVTTTLTQEQQKFFQANGYLIGLPPIFTREEMKTHNEKMNKLAELLGPGETFKDIREWHETSRWMFDIGMNPDILDLVEGILGPDFYLWASNFFAKAPRTKETVGWHQDAYYWPMEPHHSVTVWLAFTDVDEDNGAMKIVPGSHEAGVIEHQRYNADETDSVLTLLLERGTFKEDTAVSLCLRAGEVSMHDDRAVHGSPANPSDRPRVGLTFRYSGTDVKNDLSVNPNFKALLARGTDRYHHNPEGVPPTNEFGRPSFKPVSLEEVGRM
jgi:non-haem Fe2+, alpha-ketoglutarate-dependent halogenase